MKFSKLKESYRTCNPSVGIIPLTNEPNYRSQFVVGVELSVMVKVRVIPFSQVRFIMHTFC